MDGGEGSKVDFRLVGSHSTASTRRGSSHDTLALFSLGTESHDVVRVHLPVGVQLSSVSVFTREVVDVLAMGCSNRTHASGGPHMPHAGDVEVSKKLRKGVVVRRQTDTLADTGSGWKWLVPSILCVGALASALAWRSWKRAREGKWKVKD